MTSTATDSDGGLPEGAVRGSLSERTRWGWLAGITLLAAVLRFYRLGHQPLWMDEVFTFDAARALSSHGVSAMTAIDGTSPVFTSLAALSMVVGRPDEFWVRLPSAIAGIAAVPLMFVLVRRMFGRERLAMACALAMALSPFAVWYSQEARGYSVDILCSMALVLVSWGALSYSEPAPSPGTRWRRLGLAALFSTLGMGSHPTFLFLMATIGVMLLARRRPALTVFWWAASQALAVLIYLPWALGNQGEASRSTGIDSATTVEHVTWLGYSLIMLTVGPTLGPTLQEVRLQGTQNALTGHPITTVLTLIAGVAIAWTWWRGGARLGRGTRSWLLVWALGPIIGLLTAVSVVGLIFSPRYAASAVVPVMIMVGMLFDQVWEHRGHLVSAGLILAMSLWGNGNWYFSKDYAKEDVRGVIPVIRSVLGPDDTLLLAHDSALLALDHYGFTCPASVLTVQGSAGLDALKTAVARRGGGRTLVLEYRQWEGIPDDLLQPVIAQLGPATQVWQWPGVRLTLRPTRIAMAPGSGLVSGCHHE